MSTEIEEIFSTATADGKAGSLGLDKEGRLYWNGKEIITKQEVKLQLWVNVSIIVGAASTLVLAIVSVIQLIRTYSV